MGKSIRASSIKAARHIQAVEVLEAVEKPRAAELSAKLAASIAAQNAEAGGPVIEQVPEATNKLLRELKKSRKHLIDRAAEPKTLRKPRKRQLRRKSTKASKFIGGR